jgi:hypothetical protein
MRLCLLHEAEAGQIDIIQVARILESEVFSGIKRLGKDFHSFQFNWPSPVSDTIRDDVIRCRVSAGAGGRSVAERTYLISLGTGKPGKQKTRDEKWADIMRKAEQATQSIPLFLARTIFGVLNKERRVQAGPIMVVQAMEKEKVVETQNYPITSSGLKDLKLDIWDWAKNAVLEVMPGAQKLR